MFLVGDTFDFWFEYKHVVPKYFIRILGKLAFLSDNGVKIHLFGGNHDMWMFGYLEEEMRIVYHDSPVVLQLKDTSIFVGHGDGLGPSDRPYKMIKKIFENKFCRKVFRLLHPDIGICLAKYWSKHSRLGKSSENKSFFLGEEEWLYQFCLEYEKKQHYQYYIFGHRHLPFEMEVGKYSRYINLGEWINYSPYAVFDGQKMQLMHFQKKT